jgi:hypothetical protein
VTARPVGRSSGRSTRSTSSTTAITIVAAAAVLLVAAAAVLLVGCSGGNTLDGTVSMTSHEAKQSIVDIVDRSYAELGGEWTVQSGPAVQSCALPSGDSGAAFTYIVDRAPGGDPSSDIKKLQDFWSSEGITAGPYKNGGSNPVHGLSGVGGPTTSTDLYADPAGYAIEGFSVCTVGDAAEMQGNGE